MKNAKAAMFWDVILIALIGAVTLTVLAMMGCAMSRPRPIDVSDSTPAVGTAIDKGKAHVESADALVKRALPESNVTGKALLGVATDEHGKAITELSHANTELANVQEERGQLVKAVADRDQTIDARDGEIAKIKAGWGYRLQSLVAWAWFWIKVYFFMYLAINIAAPFVPGMWGGVLAKVGSWINPFSIVQEGRRLIWKFWMKPAEAASTISPAVVIPANP